MPWCVSITSSFYDDIHGLLAPLATGSVKPVLYTFECLTVEGSERVGGVGASPVWPSSLINDWFVLARLFHSSCKLDSMQILGWMLLSLKHNPDAQ